MSSHCPAYKRITSKTKATDRILRCPKCDSINTCVGLSVKNVYSVLLCEDCGWMHHKVIMARTGPELDRLIATKVMDWIEVNPRSRAAYWALDIPMNPQMANLDWSPSTDVNIAMGDVVQQMKDDGYQLELRTYMDPAPGQKGVTTGCRFLSSDEIDKEWAALQQWHPGDDEKSGHADSIPLAICRAALIAVVNVSPVNKADLRSSVA